VAVLDSGFVAVILLFPCRVLVLYSALVWSFKPDFSVRDMKYMFDWLSLLKNGVVSRMPETVV
jgi:hypothetical protein